jgi:redox-sensitive bicupin YhaK (pirin superfamily)
MQPANYRDILPNEIPTVLLSNSARIKVIAGNLEHEGRSIRGAVRGVSTEPTYFDVELPANAELSLPRAADHNAFVYAYEGELLVGPAGEEATVSPRSAIVLGNGDTVIAKAGARGARFLLLAAKPIGEPVVQYGPFVMNTEAEIR